MINKLLLLSIIFCCSIISIAQTVKVEGKVGYISSQLVYVGFENTDGISEGDSLYLIDKGKSVAVLKVKYISSKSAACERLKEIDFKADMILIANIKPETHNIVETTSNNVVITNEEVKPEVQEFIKLDNSDPELKTEVNGRYSLQSYSNFNNFNTRGDYQRWRHSFKLGIKNLGTEGLSFSTYSIFAYKADEWNKVSSSLGSALKVYDLNLNYKFSNSTQFWFGRYLNRKISNISIVDGLQFENSFSFLTVGLVLGSRPNFSDFGLNTKLFEYGLYLNRADTIGSGFMENTLSVFEQTNNFVTDRRFVYLQHSNNIVQRLNLFASTEIDLYKKEKGVSKNTFSLTSLYLSASYSPVREFSFNVSYDARKNVYYYETFKSVSDSILENETRQGFRVRTTIRPVSNLILGLHYGFRENKNDLKGSTNYGGNISYTALPLINASAGFNFNRLSSNYLDGYVYAFNIVKYLSDYRSDISFGFRQTDYTFLNNAPDLNEKALLIDFSTSAFSPFSFSISYEGVFESTRTYGRVLLDITTRF